MTEDQCFAQWDSWLKIIHEDIQWLLIKRHIFWQIQEIIKANPRIQKSNVVYTWMGSAYVNDQVIGVRRQADTMKGVISFRKLLEAIRQKPQVLSRQRFVSRYKLELSSLGHQAFDKLAGPSKAHSDRATVDTDLQQLKNNTKHLQDYANDVIAHTKEKPTQSLPTFEEPDTCLDFLESLLRKYRFLFYSTHEDILPLLPPVWMPKIFRRKQKGQVTKGD